MDSNRAKNGAYGRSSDYYVYLIKYIKRLEKDISDLTEDLFKIDWCLYGGIFEKLSNNLGVCIPSEKQYDSNDVIWRIGWWGRNFMPMN